MKDWNDGTCNSECNTYPPAQRSNRHRPSQMCLELLGEQMTSHSASLLSTRRRRACEHNDCLYSEIRDKCAIEQESGGAPQPTCVAAHSTHAAEWTPPSI